MKRVILIVAAILLAVPALAHAKTGVGFQTDPAAYKPGERQQFTVALFHEPRDPGGQATPYGGHGHPLITFKSASGQIVRVRAHELMGGTSWGYVKFPDKGPWSTVISYRGHVIHDGERSGTFSVGTDLLRVTPPPPVQTTSGGGFTWWPLLGLVPLAGIVAWLVRRRRPRGLAGGAA